MKVCGKCCPPITFTHNQAYRVVEKYGGNLAKYFEMRPHGFLTKVQETIRGDVIERTCGFLKDNLCSIYEDRPTVCREYRCDCA